MQRQEEKKASTLLNKDSSIDKIFNQQQGVMKNVAFVCLQSF